MDAGVHEYKPHRIEIRHLQRSECNDTIELTLMILSRHQGDLIEDSPHGEEGLNLPNLISIRLGCILPRTEDSLFCDLIIILLKLLIDMERELVNVHKNAE